ncbi:hypothetical protein [Salinigranum sp.]|uniref:hypothetical protein n=1 Tax=Salinigranum sp. TaxID=1966351 RepID=UPI00356A00FE
MAESRGTTSDAESGDGGADVEAELRRVRAENRRLRADRTDALAGRHRRGALGFALLGLLSAGAGYAFPESRTVLFSLAGIGLFGAVLTYYLTAAPSDGDATARDVYTAYAGTLGEMAGELGLRDVSVYVPPSGADADDATAADGSGVRLFVPQAASYEVPVDADAVFLAGAGDGRRGIAVRPIGAVLFDRFEATLVDPLAETPGALATQLAAALVESLELVAEATPEYDADNDRVTLLVRGSTLAGLDRFDHPVVSFVATGLARGLGRPVRTGVHAREGDETLLVFSFDGDGASGDPQADTDQNRVEALDEDDGPGSDDPESDGDDDTTTG